MENLPYETRQQLGENILILEDARVLVTGGAGFIGSEVVRQLCEKKAHVTVLDNFSSGKRKYIEGFDDVEVIESDICDEEKISTALKDQEFVTHLAALPFIPDSYNFPQEFFNINTIGTINIIWQSIQTGSVERFVHISTSEVYGSSKYIPMDEDHPTLPHSTYAVSKLAADRAVFTMHKEHGFPVVIIRPFNSFGPNITQPYIIPEIILQLLNGNSTLHLGNVESSRDFTFVSDTAKGIILALSEKRAIGETINLGRSVDIKIRDLAFLLAELMGKEIRIETDHARLRPFDVERLCCSNKKAEELLGWRPIVPLEDGLKSTIEWIKNEGLSFKDPFGGWTKTYNPRSIKFG
jgi:nucleoside-diphosphate-sugar epimerase